MDIFDNNLTREIPNALGNCLSLELLSLMGNSFQGFVPSSFSSLKGLQILDLSLNNLSGQIPLFFQNLSSSLQYLNLSFNNFEGAVPTEGVFGNVSAFSILGNKKPCGGISELQLPKCPKMRPDHKKSCMITATVSFLDLHRATNGFSPTNLIGTGHFGSVFKAIIREGTEPVAVKVLNMIDHKASKSFMEECEALRNVRHRNLVKILTACSTVDIQGNDFKANHTDQLALLAFKSQISHDPLQVLNSWNTSLHFCQWQGVTCGRRYQRVVKLVLKSRGLAGSLSPYIGNLSFLHTIDLGNNSFRGEIPSSEVLGRLFRLRVFALSSNSFAGELPSNFSRNLESLSLGRNKLSGTFPKQLCALQKLKRLRLARNNLTGSLPYDLGNLSSLQFIDLASNFLEGGIPDSIGQLKSLYLIALDENKLSSKLPPSIYNLSSLWTLGLTMNRIVDRLPSDIGRTFLPNLRGLFIAENHFFGPLPSSLFNISTLEILELSSIGFTGKVPDNMGNMQKLQFLGFSRNNQLGSSGHAIDLKFLSSINSTILRVIQASYCQLSGILHKSLANISFTQLEKLSLSGNQISGIIPSEIFLKLPNLTRLQLDHNFLTEQVFGPTSHGLLYAYLADNSFTGSLPVEVGNFEYLVVMDVSNNYLEGEIPDTLSKCLSLQQLSLMGNSFRGSIPPSFSSLQGLTFLDLSQNNFSGPIPMFLQNLSSSWRYLNLSFNNFEGAMPTQGIFQNASAFSILGNNKLCGGISDLQLPRMPDHQAKALRKHQISLGPKVAIGVIVSTIVVALFSRRRSLGYEKNQKATDGFSPKKLNWYRHFGSVFKAIIREGTEPVAVKVLNMIDHKASKSFMAECEALRNVRHRNLMKILTRSLLCGLSRQRLQSLNF
ncbi:hypothetical protein Syun_031239 [Stephania yunnanensis]|uniref:Protein kinase domain-containing protein n=1 Tax=Stephania yunnanensis TaxID=152371 RepID=A0AAP0HB66_9MAGN